MGGDGAVAAAEEPGTSTGGNSTPGALGEPEGGGG